jgi:Na+/melibiose symporter-like transporter
LSFIWLPAVGYAAAMLPVLFYHRYEREEGTIRQELAQRRALSSLMSGST